MNTLTVYRNGGEDQYVSKEDYDDAIKDAQIMISNLELELRRVRKESDWRWFQDHIKAMQSRYEAELDMYRVPPGYHREPCRCCDKRKARKALLDVMHSLKIDAE